MSGSEALRGARSRPPVRRGPVAIVAIASGVLALALGGHGLLVPAGPESTLVRVAGALVSLAAVAVLVRLDGPARGTRTLAVVAVAGSLTALATLPSSPITLDAPADRAALPPAGGDEGGGTVVLDRPGLPPGGGATLVLPPGARPELADGQVVGIGDDGSRAVLGPAAPGTAIERDDGTVAVVVGDGVLLDVPAPLPSDRRDDTDALADPVEAVLALLLGAFALLAFAPPLVRTAARLEVPDLVEAPPDPAPHRAAVEDGLAEVLRAMLGDPDPRTAVIGAYGRLLVALAEAGVPRRPEEGPHEHLWRTLGPLGVRRTPVHRLAELFVRAKFTPRPITEEHRSAAIAALADAVSDLRLQAGDAVDLLEPSVAEGVR